MEEFDDKLPKRKFDNFQFVPFNDIMAKAENREITFRYRVLLSFVYVEELLSCHDAILYGSIPHNLVDFVLMVFFVIAV